MRWVIILSTIVIPRMAEAWLSAITNRIEDAFNLELCNDRYIYTNTTLLRDNLEEHLFGQHLVQDKLIAAVQNHLVNEPKKALVISMHGWTGCGKSYVARLMASSLYRRKESSKFVHFFHGRLHFPRTDPVSLEQYKINLQAWVEGNVSACPRSMFIFDEIDKVPAHVFEGIKPMMDYYTSISSVDYRKSVFVFISNLGDSVIARTYKELWESGVRREKMEYNSFEPRLRKTLYNTEGVFERSEILRSHLVSLYLPFLPMEKVHLRKCIEVEVEAQRKLGHFVDLSHAVETVLESLEFYEDTFCTSGCKRVADHVALLTHSPRTEL